MAIDFKKSIGVWQNAKNPEWYNSTHITPEDLKKLIQGDGGYYRIVLQENKFKKTDDNKPEFKLFILKENKLTK